MRGKAIGLGDEDRLGRQLLTGVVVDIEVALIGPPAVDDGLLGIDVLVEPIAGKEVLNVESADADCGHKDPPTARTVLCLFPLG
jgi:hypothetical protein